VAARSSVDARREQILSATVAQVQRSGFEHTRVADVASALGISPALVFYHFETKEQLLAQAFAFAAEQDLARLEAVVASPRSARTRLRAALRLYSPDGATPSSWALWVDAWGAALRYPELRRVSRRLDVHWREAIARIIEDGIADGEFRCADPQAAAWRITALIDGLSIQMTVHRGLLTRRQVTGWVNEHAARELGLDRLGRA